MTSALPNRTSVANAKRGERGQLRNLHLTLCLRRPARQEIQYLHVFRRRLWFVGGERWSVGRFRNSLRYKLRDLRARNVLVGVPTLRIGIGAAYFLPGTWAPRSPIHDVIQQPVELSEKYLLGSRAVRLDFLEDPSGLRVQILGPNHCIAAHLRLNRKDKYLN